MIGMLTVTVHGALHPAARHPASKIAVACIQPLAVRRLFNGLDALQFAAGWAVNCNNVNQITTNLSSTKYKKYVMLITV